MAKLIDYNLEANDGNPDGDAVTFYFDGKPTDDEVKQACLETAGKLQLSVDPADKFFQWFEGETVVSKRANLIRVQAHPTG